MADFENLPPITTPPAKPKGSRDVQYTGPVYPSLKNEAGDEVGVYELYPDGSRLRPWLWTAEEYDKYAAAHPDHLVLARFKKV